MGKHRARGRRRAWVGWRGAFVLLACLGILGARSAPGQTAVLTASADTYLKSGSSNQNEGTAAFLRVQSSGKNRSLVRFDRAAIEFDVTADLRDVLAGGANFGWLVKKTEEGQNGQADYTSRQGTAGQGPRLMLVVESAAFDEVPPRLTFAMPASDLVVGDATPAIRIDYADGGTGIDPGTFALTIDGVDATAGCAVGSASAVCEPPVLAVGVHTLVATVADQAGNSAQTTRTLELLLGPGLQTATFPAVADTYLRDGSPNQNQGGESILRVRQSGKNRTLVRFDAAAIAATLDGAMLRSAHLELAITKNGDNWGTSGRNVNAHRLTAD